MSQTDPAYSFTNDSNTGVSSDHNPVSHAYWATKNGIWTAGPLPEDLRLPWEEEPDSRAALPATAAKVTAELKPKRMTVADLKELLENVPEDAFVTITSQSGWWVNPLGNVSYDGDENEVGLS